MNKIITKSEAFKTRAGIECFITIKVQEVNMKLEKGNSIFIIQDEAVVFDQKEIPNEDPEIESTFINVLRTVEVIERRAVAYTNKEIDEMFKIVNKSILKSESFNEQFNEVQLDALLLETQHAPLYGTTTDDWKIYVAEVEPTE